MTVRPLVRCPVCGLQVGQTPRGRVVHHQTYAAAAVDPGGPAGYRCAGAGQMPRVAEPPPAPTSTPAQDDADVGEAPTSRRAVPLPYELALGCDRCRAVDWLDLSEHCAPGTLTPCGGKLERRAGWRPNQTQLAQLMDAFNFDVFDALFLRHSAGHPAAPATVATWIAGLPIAAALDERWVTWLEQAITDRDELLEVRRRLLVSHAGAVVRGRLGDPDRWEWPGQTIQIPGATSDVPEVPGGPPAAPEVAPLPPAPPGARWLTPAQAAALRPHPAAALFPAMDAQSCAALREDLRAQGQIEAIEIADDLVLDGRHRLAALLELGRPVLVRDAPAGADLIARSVGLNLHRRHLSVAERASLGARLRPAIEAARATTAHQLGLLDGAPERPAWRADIEAGGWRCCACAELVIAASPPVDPCRTCAARAVPLVAGDGTWSDVAARLLEVSPRSIEQAAAVQREGAPELAAALDRGELAPSVAADLSRLPIEEQRRVLASADPRVVRAAATAAAAAAREARAARRAEALSQAARSAAAAAPQLLRPGAIEWRVGRVLDLVTRDELAASSPLIFADPPWQFTNGGNGAAGKHYRTMPMEDIRRDLEAAVHAAHPDGALLAVWIPPSLLAEWFSRPLLGWAYATGGGWLKEGELGIGHLWRGQVEILLVYRRGSVAPHATVRNGHVSRPDGEHSEKPGGWLEDLVDAWCPEGGLVLDLYAGLGSLGRAVDRVGGRRYIGIELDKSRAQQARDKLTLDRASDRWGRT